MICFLFLMNLEQQKLLQMEPFLKISGLSAKTACRWNLPLIFYRREIKVLLYLDNIYCRIVAILVVADHFARPVMPHNYIKLTCIVPFADWDII